MEPASAAAKAIEPRSSQLLGNDFAPALWFIGKAKRNSPPRTETAHENIAPRRSAVLTTGLIGKSYPRHERICRSGNLRGHDSRGARPLPPRVWQDLWLAVGETGKDG